MNPTDPCLLWSSTLRRSAIRHLFPMSLRLGQFTTLLQSHAAVAGAQLIDTRADLAALEHEGDSAPGHSEDQVPADCLEEGPAVFGIAFLSHVAHNNTTLQGIP